MPSNPTQKETNAEKAKILVIDDEESILNLMNDILTAEGYVVSLAENGEKGVQLAQKEEFNLIIVDIMMPGIDGIETIKRIRQFNTVVGIIILTAYGKRKDAVIDAVKYGVFDYVTKPFDVDYLLSLIKYVLHKSKFLRMPYLDTMRDFYWEKEVSQKDLVQKKWSDLKEQVESSSKVLAQDKRRIEKYYIKFAPNIEVVRYFVRSFVFNKYLLIVLMCLLTGIAFGYFFNRTSLSRTDYDSYVSRLKMRDDISLAGEKEAGKITLSDFYDLMKNIEQWMKKDVEQGEKQLEKFEKMDRGKGEE